MLLHPDFGTVQRANVAVVLDETSTGLFAECAAFLSHGRRGSCETKLDMPSFDQDDWYESNRAAH